jgi:uncharacterized protein
MALSLDITPSIPSGLKIIQSYGGFRFKVSNVIYDTPVVVFPGQIIPWVISSIDELDSSSFSCIGLADRAIEILLIGCGTRMAFIHPTLRLDLKNIGIAIESMDTGAACRTYNVLVAEDRRVAAALIPVD